MSIEDIKGTLRRRRETARILIDQTPIDVMAELDRRLAAAIAADDSLAESAEIVALREQVEAAQQAIVDAEVEFAFEGIGRQAITKLQGQYPPTPDEEKAGEDVSALFTVHLVAATCVSRELDAEDAAWLWENLDHAEWNKLWTACLVASYGQATRPKSVAASALRLTSVPSWLTAALAASPDPSSSADSGPTL